MVIGQDVVSIGVFVAMTMYESQRHRGKHSR